MKWIDIKEECPPISRLRKPFVLAYHTTFGVGTAWFFSVEEDEIENWKKEGLKYICSCDFIQSIEDHRGLPDVEECIDIFESPSKFSNIGTVTHWMRLPLPPEENIKEEYSHQKDKKKEMMPIMALAPPNCIALLHDRDCNFGVFVSTNNLIKWQLDIRYELKPIGGAIDYIVKMSNFSYYSLIVGDILKEPQCNT